MRTIAEVNAMTLETFMGAFGDVAEHSPWVAEGAAGFRPFNSREAMIGAFSHVVEAAAHARQLALIRAHPDLATKARLTSDSTREQQGAGLASLGEEEFARFTHLNDSYKAKFGFPFIFAVKGATKQQILASFEVRLSSSVEGEFTNAIAQVCRIFRFRIEDRVAP
jgi:2-oxo-4-hydroxy-4-carboxy-5-ureidoimidazoline decarboxylase